MNWETYLAIDVKIFRKLVKVVLEHAVDEVAAVFGPGSDCGFSVILAEVRSAIVHT